MKPTSRYISGKGWMKMDGFQRHSSTGANIIPDIAPYYSESLDTEVKSRKHRDQLLRDRDLRMYENGEKTKPKQTPYVLSEQTKKLHSYVRSHGVNWNFVEKFCPELLPRR